MDLQNRKQNCFRSLVSSAIVLAAAMSGVSAQEKTTVILGTATPGGGFQIYGAAYSAVLNEMDKTLAIEQRGTKGSTENAPLLAEGKLDIGLATGEVTYEALAGIGRPPADLKIINAMYPNSGMFIVRADSPYRTLADLKGKPVAWGASGSGFVVLARYVFDGLGMSIEKDFQPIFLEHAGDGSKMVLDGRAAALWGGGVGWPGFVEVSNAPGGASFITPDAEGRTRRSRRSAPGRSFSRGRRCPTKRPTNSRARCTRARRRSARSSRRRANRRSPTRSPPRRGRT